MAYDNNYAHVYLTRRNLLTLLAKLDRVKAGDTSQLTILKQDTVHKEYPCSHITQVTAVEDSDYYTDRKPGGMHPKDEEVIDAANHHGADVPQGIWDGKSIAGGTFERGE